MLIAELLWGPLLESTPAWPLILRARMCDLRSRFIAKGRVGQGYRAIARNGRVLLATDRPLAELVDRSAHMRLQVWRRAILPGDPAEDYGILLCVRCNPPSGPCPILATRLVTAAGSSFALAVDLGGGRVLEFRRTGEDTGDAEVADVAKW